jgi:alkylhydroperoxidase family enzyme
MPRVPLVDEHVAPEVASIAARIRNERGGKLLTLYQVLLQSPKLAEAWLQFFTVVRQQCDLSARHRELAILYVAVLNGAQYEYEQHVPFALAAGFDAAQLEAIPAWESSDRFEPADRAVLAYTRAMTREIRVPDAVYAAVAAHFAPPPIVELTATIGGYNLVSRFLEALEIH